MVRLLERSMPTYVKVWQYVFKWFKNARWSEVQESGEATCTVINVSNYKWWNKTQIRQKYCVNCDTRIMYTFFVVIGCFGTVCSIWSWLLCQCAAHSHVNLNIVWPLYKVPKCCFVYICEPPARILDRHKPRDYNETHCWSLQNNRWNRLQPLCCTPHVTIQLHHCRIY